MLSSFKCPKHARGYGRCVEILKGVLTIASDSQTGGSDMSADGLAN